MVILVSRQWKFHYVIIRIHEQIIFLVKILYVISLIFSFLFQVANALGYIHAKNITHGRLCSRNIFLEHKVQLSLLDYTIGQSNLVYSSPQLLQVTYYLISNKLPQLLT